MIALRCHFFGAEKPQVKTHCSSSQLAGGKLLVHCRTPVGANGAEILDTRYMSVEYVFIFLVE